jgi:hypothetical protein
MAGELVKWSGGKPVRISPDTKRRVISEALALLTSAPVSPARGNRAGLPVSALQPGDVVDLARVCAVHDKPYAARYVMGADGRYRRGPMIEVTEALFLRQYAANGVRRVVRPQQILFAEETCIWCGACGVGSVLCGGCWHEVCYGRMAGRFFRCRSSCGWQGNMIWRARNAEGVTPGETRGGGYGV